jgi:hypothetical protein
LISKANNVWLHDGDGKAIDRSRNIFHAVSTRRERRVIVHLHPNFGKLNGDPDGLTTLRGTGDSSFGGSSPGTSGHN